MLEVRFLCAFQLRYNPLSQDLTELDTPLIEWIDIPDHSLREDVVLIQSHELSQHAWSQPFGEDRV